VRPWRLLLTRPAEDSAALAGVLAQDGVHSSCLPLLSIEALPLGGEQLERVRQFHRYDLVIVVSKPAARLGVGALPKAQAQAALWFAVGAGTAQVLIDQGLNVHFPAQGDDSEALLRLPALLAQLDRPAPRVLIMRGEGGREWLAEQLRARGATVDYLELYRRQLPEYPAHTLRERVAVERLNGVVVSSGQGFEHLCQLAGEEDGPLLRRLPLFVPSQRVAEMAIAAGSENVINCGGASALALREALRERHPAPEAR
jgi:uroporphyrinogen-III synthase